MGLAGWPVSKEKNDETIDDKMKSIIGVQKSFVHPCDDNASPFVEEDLWVFVDLAFESEWTVFSCSLQQTLISLSNNAQSLHHLFFYLGCCRRVLLVRVLPVEFRGWGNKRASL
jgi:hypothetical protein